LLSFQFWYFVHQETNKPGNAETDIAIVLMFILSWIIIIALLCLAVFAAIKVKIKMILYVRF